jgi:tRNA(adenine34) deaminase
MEDICLTCGKPLSKCTCCPECGHICSLDYGEPFCPVCLPEIKKDTLPVKNHEYFMTLALKEAEKAFSEGEVPVGAVIVKDTTVIAKAHNLREKLNDPTAHAELIALRQAASELKTWRITDTILYVTKEPCVMCAGAMINARIGMLVYGCNDQRYGAVTNIYSIPSDPALNHKIDVISGVLEHECADILKRFFVKLRR